MKPVLSIGRLHETPGRCSFESPQSTYLVVHETVLSTMDHGGSRNPRWRLRSFDDIVRSFDDIVRSFDDIVRSFDDIMRSFDDIMRSIDDLMRSIDDIMRSIDDITRPIDDITTTSDRSRERIRSVHGRLYPMTTKTLTKRQQEVLSLWLSGVPYRELAAELGIAPGTVNPHLKAIRIKLDAAGISREALGVAFADRVG